MAAYGRGAARMCRRRETAVFTAWATAAAAAALAARRMVGSPGQSALHLYVHLANQGLPDILSPCHMMSS